MLSIIDKLRQGLARTRQSLAASLRGALDRGRVDEDLFADFERVLIAADVGVEATETLLARLRERVRAESLATPAAAEMALKAEIVALLESVPRATPADPARRARPHVIMLVGVNGVGKTTTIGKLAKREMDAGRRVLVGACDTFRAAAGEQLAAWAERAGVEIVRQRSGADPAAVAFDAVAAGESRGVDVILLDTAGRLHTKANLMEELKKVHRVVARRLAGAPHEVLLCLDATTGQNAIRQAKLFDSTTGITGLVLAKLDGTARGGVVVAIANELKLPVEMVGVGEGIDDLVPFDAQAFVEAMFEETGAGHPGGGR